MLRLCPPSPPPHRLAWINWPFSLYCVLQAVLRVGVDYRLRTVLRTTITIVVINPGSVRNMQHAIIL